MCLGKDVKRKEKEKVEKVMSNKEKWSRKVKPRREFWSFLSGNGVQTCSVLFWESGAGECQGLVDASSPGSYRTLLCLGLVPGKACVLLGDQDIRRQIHWAPFGPQCPDHPMWERD